MQLSVSCDVTLGPKTQNFLKMVDLELAFVLVKKVLRFSSVKKRQLKKSLIMTSSTLL